MGDPGLDPVWLELDQVLAMDWPDAWGRRWKAQSLGLDAGYLPQRCYAYARRHAGHPRPKVFALDGRPKWGLAPIGTPSVQDVDFLGKKIGAVQLWPVGTWDLKTELSAALRLTEMGPDTTGAWPRGAMRFPQVVSQEFFQQLTAEACVTIETRQGYERREWRKIAQRNEQWDLAVYARALARHYTANWTEARWQNLIAERSGPGAAVQGDLLDLAAAPEAADAALAAARQAALAEAEAAAARAEVQRVQQAAARQAARRPPPTTWGHAPTWGASGW
jgi:phage terminase large subunit GpA-like protein